MIENIFPGRVVFSKKGRDKCRYFVVLYMVDADFAFVSDGETRKLSRMKKKRLKHLRACPYEFPDFPRLYKEGRLLDSDIRKALYPIKQTTDTIREG